LGELGERSWERGRRRKKRGKKERERGLQCHNGFDTDSLTSTEQTMPEIHNYACPKWRNL